MTIKSEIVNRDITRLCHFTKSSKLLHIMSSESGIIADEFIEADVLTPNDPYRFDGLLDCISCSVEYPNTYYLARIKHNDPLFKEWVILFVDPLLMCEDSTLFCFRNAAAERGSLIRSGFEGFQGMFADTVFGHHKISRTTKRLACCPTDAQAEVMIYKSIPRNKIMSVAVPTFEQAKLEQVRLSYLPEAPEVKFIVAPDLFNNNWMSLVRNGQRPTELEFTGDEV